MLSNLEMRNGNLPDTEEYTKIVSELEAAEEKTLHTVQYLCQNGQTSLSAQWEPPVLGPLGPENGAVQAVCGESRYYDYLLYLPENYDPSKKWPVIYFFHGIAERGSDVRDLLRQGMPKYLARGGKLDAIMIAPQCPLESHWADTDTEVEEHLRYFLPEIAEKYAIDPDRVYITGLSMGGRCTWKLALAMPEYFAAMAVVCGRTNTYEFERLHNIPIWLIHGVQDDIVFFFNINRICPVLAATGHPDYRLTIYPHADHDVWTPSYESPELYQWLLSHRRRQLR